MPHPRPLATVAAVALIALAAAPVAASIFHGGSIEGSGDLETRTLDLGAFDEITIGGAFGVEIRFGDEQRVDVTIDDNLWDNLEVRIRKGRLHLDWNDSCRPDHDCRVAITMPRLQAMSVHGASEVRIIDFAGERFSFEVSGAADLEMDGRVDRLNVKVSGAGEIDTRDLQAKHVEVRISGAGNANITATESLDAEVSGVGSIDYWGDPQRKRTSVSGLGNIDAH